MTKCSICSYSPLLAHALRKKWGNSNNDHHYRICCTCAEYGYGWEPTDTCHECGAPRPFPIHADYEHMDYCCACAVKLYPERYERPVPDCSEDHPWIDYRKRVGQIVYEATIAEFNRQRIKARQKE